MNMKIKDAAKLMTKFAEIYPDCELTFANNKVAASKIVYDEKTKSINIR